MLSSPRLQSLLILALIAACGPAQEKSLQLEGILVTGGRATLTESWSAMSVTVFNPFDTPRNARVVLYFPDRPAVHFGRDLWVPPRSRHTSVLPLGPAPQKAYPTNCEIHALLYDRTDGRSAIVLPPTEEKTRSVLAPHRSRAPSTSLIVDSPLDLDPLSTGSVRDDITALIHTVRATGGMPESLPVIPVGALPLLPEAFDGTDHIVIASNRIASDPAGIRALRQWVQQGGRLWFMLDQVSLETVAPFLGEDPPFEVLDRVGLTTLRLHKSGLDLNVPPREFDQPVDLVRVIPTESDQVLVTANDWPAAFARTMGRGRIMFTTLGPRGWTRVRGAKDLASRYPMRKDMPVALPPVESLADELNFRHPLGLTNELTNEDFQPLLVEEIGYSIASRGTVAAIMGAFLLTLIGLGLALRRSRQPERVGWLAPAAAVVTGGVLVALAFNARSAVPPTVAAAGIADATNGSGDIAVSGLFAVYQPSSGELPLATKNGGQIELSEAGLEGQSRRRIQTDVDAWHWEELNLPSGVRTGPFKRTLPTGGISAVARFGPNGLEGRLIANGFTNLDDMLIATSARKPTALTSKPDGAFSATLDDMLPADQFVAGTVFSDKQQRRQTIYRKLLTGTLPRHMEGRDFLLAWSDQPPGAFESQPGARTIGSTLIVVPVEYERPAPDTRVTVPQSFIPVRRMQTDALIPVMREGTRPADMRIRFQLPDSVRKLRVESATLHLKLVGPLRRIVISGVEGKSLTMLKTIENPADPIHVVIDRGNLLQVDERGGLILNLAVTNLEQGEVETPWRIESIGLDVVGRTPASVEP